MMKHWRLATLTFLVFAISFACDLERRAEFPDQAEQLVPASGTVVPAQAVTSAAPAAVSAETPERAQAKIQQANPPKKTKAPAATDNPYGATDEGIVVVLADGGGPAYEAAAVATRGTDAALPNRVDGAASAKATADAAITPQPQQDATTGAGEASAGEGDEGTDDGSWF
jgi:hypothetical protein